MTKKVVIRLLDEVNCVIAGLHPTHIDYFCNTYSRRAPNFWFNPKFKLGVWDGFIRFFGKTGKTYINLLPEIIRKITALDYVIDIDDQRSGVQVTPELVTDQYFAHIQREDNTPVILRDYQVEAVNCLITNGGGIVIAGTGAGKTLINATIADVYGRLGQPTITIVPNGDLIEQTIEEFDNLSLDVGEYSGTRKDLNHTHVVSTWQALQNNPDILRKFKVVIVDECHGLRGNVLTKLLNEHGSHIVHRFGLTGTLPKEEADSMAVRVAVGDVQFSIPAYKLIENKWLASLHISIMQLAENIEDGYFPDYDAEKAFLHVNHERLAWISGYIQEKRNQHKGNVLCLVDSVVFGKRLQKLIPDSVLLYGKDKRKVRREAYDLFETRNDMVVIATVQIAGVGLSIDRIFNLIFVDIGKSFIRVIQTIGRGLRKGVDKDHVDVTDICSDLKYAKKHTRTRMKYYREAQYPYKKQIIQYK